MMKRVLAVAGMLALLRCSTYGAEPEPVEAPTRDGGSDGSGGEPAAETGGGGSSGGSSSGGSSSGGSSSGGGASDGASDANVVPPCTLLKNGDTCTQSSTCCSGKCNEARTCANDCETAGQFNCDPSSTTECCVGLWCNVGACTPCILSGQPAAQSSGTPLPHSCCSRQLQGGTGPNCQ